MGLQGPVSGRPPPEWTKAQVPEQPQEGLNQKITESADKAIKGTEKLDREGAAELVRGKEKGSWASYISSDGKNYIAKRGDSRVKFFEETRFNSLRLNENMRVGGPSSGEAAVKKSGWETLKSNLSKITDVFKKIHVPEVFKKTIQRAAEQPEARTTVELTEGVSETPKTAEELFEELELRTKELPTFTYKEPSTDVDSRFTNIGLVDKNVVTVEVGGETKTLHANRVVTAEGTFIAAQIPLLESGYEAFWNAAFENSEVIVDLTKPDEISEYYPKVVEKPKTYGDTTVTFEGEEKLQENEQILIKEYTVKVGEKVKTIRRVHYTGWEDHSTTSTKGLKDVVNTMNKYKGSGTPIIHCRAGVGRTGTTITAARLMENPEGHEPLDKLVLGGREQRGPLFVQTLNQLKLLMELDKDLKNNYL